ncbi:hypothetical protein M9H77_22683 [Catharanthus roseus]|uniref:Uncharacterized protein n=1 Tax=Catharanthus roseus TaxID=4058 RepID=A0ACC0ASM7_CATRO|nr:hypothetical protein M9H77_22683 [Catharanthus roseus]
MLNIQDNGTFAQDFRIFELCSSDLDASKLRAFSNKAMSNFSKEAVASKFAFFISARITLLSTSMDDIDSTGVRKILSTILCHKSWRLILMYIHFDCSLDSTPSQGSPHFLKEALLRIFKPNTRIRNL